MRCQPIPAAPSVAFRKEVNLARHKDRVFDLSWSPSRPSCLASAGQTCGYVWSIDGSSVVEPVKIAAPELMRVCWHPEGARVLTGDADGAVGVWNASDGAPLAKMQASAEDEVYGLDVLAGGEGVLAVGAGNTVQLWDLDRAVCVKHVTIAAVKGGVIFGGPNRNPEGKAYLLGCATRGRAFCGAFSDGTVRLLDSQSLKEFGVLDQHARHGAPAFCVALSPNAPQLASADAQGNVLLWDLRQFGKAPLAAINHGGGAVQALEFASGVVASGELLLAGGADRMLRALDTSTALATVGSINVLSMMLCAKVAPAEATAPVIATGGGSDALISDASISLWRLEPPNTGRVACLPCVEPGDAGRLGVE